MIEMRDQRSHSVEPSSKMASRSKANKTLDLDKAADQIIEYSMN